MFGKLLHRLLKPSPESPSEDAVVADLVAKAADMTAKGNRHAAILAWREVLDRKPGHIGALNDLGACLADIGDMAKAQTTFELAYSLDEDFGPVAVNHAKVLVDQRRSDYALPFLEQAKISNPDSCLVDAIYGALCFQRGLVPDACHFAKRAWLANFDNLRLVNSYLFTRAYADTDELDVAIEHRFWAETVRPMSEIDGFRNSSPAELADSPFLPQEHGSSERGLTHRRIRIGYWSPDFRSHSVRFFFRPLIDHQDTERFEVYLYHDVPLSDEQTALIRAQSENFHEVFEVPDAELFSLVRSHRLDIFVELAGQSSYNRAAMLQERFAPLQITALGYPPTTGLSSIDGKVLDMHVVTPDADRYYTEAPLALPSSFWCFDPMQEVTPADNPPVLRNGHITFGCVGNVGKITARALDAWRRILERTPGSKLLIRSINFEDSAVAKSMTARIEDAGIDTSRVNLHRPESGIAFFETYNDIDIILDTFPFNGGTTTCFATYMAVPVVTLAGQSLLSRMGLSILSNLGVPELAVGTFDDYVDKAVALAGDTAFLTTFKREAQARFKASSLGNGRLFAREFEQACIEALRRKIQGAPRHVHHVPLLPADEMMSRAYAVLAHGQRDAANRILAHCLAHYPDSGSAHLMVAQGMAAKEGQEAAASYLLDRLERFTTPGQIAALIGVLQFYLQAGQREKARTILDRLSSLPVPDTFDAMQIRLYRASIACQGDTAPTLAAEKIAPATRFHVLIVCDSVDRFLVMRAQIAETCSSASPIHLSFERCDEGKRVSAYTASLQRDDIDVVVMVQKNIELHHPFVFNELAAALEAADIVGFAGASRWQRLDWRAEPFELKAGSFISNATSGHELELRWLGAGTRTIAEGMEVLDGSLLAARCSAVSDVPFDEELLGAETLLEEDWVRAARIAGARVAAHCTLGVMVDNIIKLDVHNRDAARMHLAEKMAIDPFVIAKDDHSALSTPVGSPIQAIHIAHTFLTADQAIHFSK